MVSLAQTDTRECNARRCGDIVRIQPPDARKVAEAVPAHGATSSLEVLGGGCADEDLEPARRRMHLREQGRIARSEARRHLPKRLRLQAFESACASCVCCDSTYEVAPKDYEDVCVCEDGEKTVVDRRVGNDLSLEAVCASVALPPDGGVAYGNRRACLTQSGHGMYVREYCRYLLRWSSLQSSPC